MSPVLLAATGLGSGYSPAMPGTVGTLWAFPLYYAMHSAGWTVEAQLPVAVLLALACFPLSSAAERVIGSKDPSCVVCDEYASYLLVLVCVPHGVAYWVGSFALFRALDIAKPWPLRLVQDRLGGGAGIMADDLLAALYTLVAVWAVEGVLDLSSL